MSGIDDAQIGDPGVAVRRVALDALVRIEDGGAYANLVLDGVLGDGAGADLPDRDRAFVTELVYGTTRMRRACDHLVDRHRRGRVEPRVRAALRLGAHQLAFAGVAPHAAVSATVGAVPKRARGLVNAVLRRVAEDVAAGPTWPDDATRLSYPDWIVDELVSRLGRDGALDALAAMNRPATTHVRADGYVQDLASQAVVDSVEAGPGALVLDACAAPGGKATGLAATGATVVAAESRPGRARLVVANRDRVAGPGSGPLVVAAADAAAPPWRPGTFDRILLDAPCSGLGVLRRRPDARWRIDADAPARLAALQVAMVEAAGPLLATGGMLVLSVCTLTVDESDGVADAARPVGPDGAPLQLLDVDVAAPDDDRDGMCTVRWRHRPGTAPVTGADAGATIPGAAPPRP